ncbi:MAG: LCP family protein, partial [Armatimonadetes bacterium]|nr:LCP family protein [Armatimonadota bacterium]
MTEPPRPARPPVYRWPPPHPTYRPRLVPWLRRRRRGCLVLVVLTALGLGLGQALLSRPFGPRREATLLVLGADQGKEHGGGARADTLLLVRLQLDPPGAVGLSLPRDTRVRIPGRRGHHKLNAAFAFGGVKLTQQTVAETFGLSADHHLVVYSAGLAGLVDAVGGIVVDVPKAMDYDDNAQDLHIHLKPGRQRLNGSQAVGFVRYRSDARADLGRIERQQVFLKALVKQALRPSLLWRWPGVIAAVREGLETDLSLFQLAGLAWSMRGVARDDLRFETLPGRPGSRGG